MAQPREEVAAKVVSHGILDDVPQEMPRELKPMPKRKSGAQAYVADGSGGMRPVTDLRFEGGTWPIDLVVPARDAETWMAHLDAEIEDRGWNSSSFSQLDSAENSGTLSVHAESGAVSADA